ncbi:MAG: hypothetical protein D4R67_00475 [Bacteroidetes bacterium]|nr:MAG: hypothetical protein D4R67_00475 [Bacteroidota bacterium]
MSKHHKQPLLTPEKYIRTRARILPIGACYINDNWKDSGFAMIIVTRQHINGNITHGAYMVDLYCLGVKDSFWNFNQHPQEFRELLEKQQRANDFGLRIRTVDYQVAHNIIYGAIEFAEEFGFYPHKSFEVTRYILEEDTDHIQLMDIEFGFKGKPLYISSPENPGEKNRVFAHLEKRLGTGNYHFITEVEADEFFEREEEDKSDAVDYHDPEVKKNLILSFIATAESPGKFMKRNPEKLVEIMENAEIICSEYMITEEESGKASATIKELFDFRISEELFSREILFGKTVLPAISKEIRRQAERLYHMASDEQLFTDKHIKEGLDEAERMMQQYPDIPVFQYLYLKFMELKTGISALLPELKEFADRDPDYQPFAYMYAMSFITNKPVDTSRRISDSLHLKNFFPGRNSFCREEVLLYMQMLILDYGLSGELAMLEEMLSYMERHYPGLMREDQIFQAKISKIPYVLEWCAKWAKENV